MSKSVKKDFGRVPERVWKDPTFREDVSDDGKLLFLTLHSLPIPHPRAAGIWCVSDAVLCEWLGHEWDTSRLDLARNSLCESHPIYFNARARVWYAPGSYWPTENPGWWVGRMRQLVNMPECELRDEAIARELNTVHVTDSGSGAFLQSLELECQVDFSEIADRHQVSYEAV